MKTKLLKQMRKDLNFLCIEHHDIAEVFGEADCRRALMLQRIEQYKLQEEERKGRIACLLCLIWGFVCAVLMMML